MRVDNSNLIEITKSKSSVEIKGNVSVQTQETTTQQVDKETGRVSYVQQTTVDRPFFSTDSELDKIRQEAENMDIAHYQDKMAVVTNTVTEEDSARMEEDGFSLNNTEVHTIVTETDKIKMELAKAGVDVSIFGDDLSNEQLQELAGSAGMAYQLEHQIEQADLPATQENLSECEETIKQAESLTACSEEAIKYLVDNELSPTVENLYKAQHSTNAAAVASSAAGNNISGDEKLQKQIEQIIAKAGLPVNDTTRSYCQWMMDNQLPLTKENLQYVADLKEMKLPADTEQVINAMMEAMQEGKRPKDAVLLEGYSISDRAAQAAETVSQATDEDIWNVVEKGLPLTIENLEAEYNQRIAQGQNVTGQKGNGQQNAGNFRETNIDAENIKFVTAKRQLEETRLIMTVQANHTLLKQGISIETKPLEELVAQLKSLENDYYKSLLSQNGIDATKENTAVFAETIEKTADLKTAPAYVIGTADLGKETVDTLHEAGMSQKAALERAGEAYEPLMTAPRTDMGDSIQKAFQNIDDILKDLGLETTEANRRAVRILAYNETAITQESISQIKAADQKVQNLFQNLSPSVVMEMIREGVNPLEMDINQLNAKAEEIKNRLDAGGEEKFSKYLWKLEQKREITPEERDSYIGIYRLLNQIEKTDGAVIGALVNQGAELSMKNLLIAVRTNRNSGINVSVDDNFGEAETIQTPELSISQQIEAAYQTDCAKEAFGRMTPEGMEQAGVQKVMEMTPEELLWQLKDTESDKQMEESWQKQQMDTFSNAKEAEAQVLRMLTGYDMPVTAYNVMAANQMLHNRNGIFKALFEPENQPEDMDLEQVKAELLEDFAEAVKTPEDMAKAQQKLAETAENVMKTMANVQNVQSMDVRDLKILRQEIELGTKMSKEETYAIPVLVADELTNVQLKIVRGKEERGRVDVIFDSPKLGKVAASFQVQKDAVKGYLASDSKDTIQEFQAQKEAICESLGMEEGMSVSLDVIQSDELELSRFVEKERKTQETATSTEEAYQVQTRTLYGVAKVFLEAIKQIEK